MYRKNKKLFNDNAPIVPTTNPNTSNEKKIISSFRKLILV